MTGEKLPLRSIDAQIKESFTKDSNDNTCVRVCDEDVLNAIENLTVNVVTNNHHIEGGTDDTLIGNVADSFKVHVTNPVDVVLDEPIDVNVLTIPDVTVTNTVDVNITNTVPVTLDEPIDVTITNTSLDVNLDEPIDVNVLTIPDVTVSNNVDVTITNTPIAVTLDEPIDTNILNNVDVTITNTPLAVTLDEPIDVVVTNTITITDPIDVNVLSVPTTNVNTLNNPYESAIHGVVAVSTTAIEAKVGGATLADRELLYIYNDSTATVFYGYTSGVTASGSTRGFPLEKRTSTSIPLSDAQKLYLIAASGTNDCLVAELKR